MKFDLQQTMEILERTPKVLSEMLKGLSDAWTTQHEGPGSWSPYDVIGHLIHGEKTDWIPRMDIMMNHGTAIPFVPFDRFAQFKESEGKTLDLLLEEFTRLRQDNLRILKNTQLDQVALGRKGTHPALGEVTLQQLLATWAAHDLGHIVQIARVMAKQYREEVGPWKAYLSVLE
ncbi:MAG: DinB family protein [Lewinellaceae bacterium]|nr:DinB family protein [Saprospiraceae bacterium]MCB9340671.1 DinB family protein [Lewinellaceae bacterium]